MCESCEPLQVLSPLEAPGIASGAPFCSLCSPPTTERLRRESRRRIELYSIGATNADDRTSVSYHALKDAVSALGELRYEPKDYRQSRSATDQQAFGNSEVSVCIQLTDVFCTGDRQLA